jgi:tetratricopeptide (TPR) repeat protein
VHHRWLNSFLAALAVVAGTELGASGESAQAPGRPTPGPAVTDARKPRPSAAAARTPAWRAFYAGNLDRAAELASASLRASAADTAARLVMARVAMERGDTQGACDELLRAQRHAPNDPDVLYYLAIVSSHLARTTFDALYKLAPDSARVHQLMAESLAAQEKNAEAATEYEAALRADPQEKNAEAATEYEAALRADPRLLEALLGLGKLKRIHIACEEAIALYERAEAIRSTFEGAFGLGTCLAVEQKDEQAIARFRQALVHDDRAAVAWEGLGSALARTGQLTEGIAALQRAIALEPRMDSAYYALGQAYRKLGDPERASAAFEKARQLQTGGAR